MRDAHHSLKSPACSYVSIMLRARFRGYYARTRARGREGTSGRRLRMTGSLKGVQTASQDRTCELSPHRQCEAPARERFRGTAFAGWPGATARSLGDTLLRRPVLFLASCGRNVLEGVLNTFSPAVFRTYYGTTFRCGLGFHIDKKSLFVRIENCCLSQCSNTHGRFFSAAF